VLPLRVTGRILASTGLGDLVYELLDFGRANFDVEVVSLCPDGVYEEEGEGAHRLDTLMSHSSSWSLEPPIEHVRRDAVPSPSYVFCWS